MFRNLALKIPSLKDTGFSSQCRRRFFRSLSPVQRSRHLNCELTERSVSCSRTEKENYFRESSDKTKRNLSSGKDCEGNIASSEIRWRENPKSSEEFEAQEVDFSCSSPQSAQFETLEQYELEAARPRKSKSTDIVESFAQKLQSINPYWHLQPNQMKPYGSQDNMYSPLLIRPTTAIRYPKKFRKKLLTKDDNIINGSSERKSGTSNERNYSTNSHQLESRELSTTKTCVAEQGHSSKERACGELKAFQGNKQNLDSQANNPIHARLSRPTLSNIYGKHWSNRCNRMESIDPLYHNSYSKVDSTVPIMNISTPAMRKRRKEEENKKGSIHYKASYSDLIKLKLKEMESRQAENDSSITINKCCTSHSLTQFKMLDAFKTLSGRRNLTTRSKSDIFLKEQSYNALNPHKPNQKLNADDGGNQRSFAKCSSSYHKKGQKLNKTKTNKGYNPDCEDICTSYRRAQEKMSERRFPYEPAKCVGETELKKVYLPSKVRLPVPVCTPRPDYADCRKKDICDVERADECIEDKPKALPKLRTNPCPCVDLPGPTITPRLHKLNLKFEDPPKEVCHVPPCQTPRADDDSPVRYKPLKPYVPKDCACIQPPPMHDVKMKRLPKCEPEEICRPVRVCPVIDPCPPRADECYEVKPKKLPFIESPDCPCVDPLPPSIAPPMKRLNLHISEPERDCKKIVPCSEVERADDGLKLTRKKLPKFVPGDCPCEERQMIDWNLKRLQCEDEEADCVVPDPCNVFPRADWGCWEYSQEVCKEVDPRCLDRREKCVKPVIEKPKLCDKKSICDTKGAGILDFRSVSKRKFSNSSLPLEVCQKVKEKGRNEPKNNRFSQIDLNSTKSKKLYIKRSLPRSSTIKLIKELNALDQPDNLLGKEFLFKPKKREKIDYESILKSIASSTAQFEKKGTGRADTIAAQTFKKHKPHTITITSRAISTTENQKDELNIKKNKECEAKQKCKNIKPSLQAYCNKKSCPRYPSCDHPDRQGRPGCKFERVPVCCTKDESPYSSYTDNLNDKIKPYTKTPQWTCNRPQYGFHPISRKEHDPLDPEKRKNKKQFSTTALITQLPVTSNLKIKENIVTNKSGFPNLSSKQRRPCSSQQSSRLLSLSSVKSISFRPTSKELLQKKSFNLFTSESRSLTTKIFQIHRPEPCKKVKDSKKCRYNNNKGTSKRTAPKINCYTEISDDCKTDKRSCARQFISTAARKPPPFPAFSDCLDEEMEDILTECPLDKEKYLRMQPRFMNPPPRPCCLLKPPPPVQGKIDLLKEEECIREKLCLENKGLTQSCEEFGQPVPILRSKKMIKEEENRDCERMKDLKKLGRWPPHTLKSSRSFSTLSNCRCFCTLGFILTQETQEENEKVKKIYVKKYHALLKSSDKKVLVCAEEKCKEAIQKLFPRLEDSHKILKFNNNPWRIHNLDIYEQINKPNNSVLVNRRNYSTHKYKHNTNRKFSTSKPLFYQRVKNYRGKRYYKARKPRGPTTTMAKEKCEIESHKKNCPKFTLNTCPPRVHRKKCHRIPYGQESSKHFSPYPAYSECKDNELITPTCECYYEKEKMPELQPRFAILNEVEVKEFPTQDRIDRALGIEYYRCKHGLINEGQTIGCDCLTDLYSTKPKQQSYKDSEPDAVEVLVQDHEKAPTELSCSRSSTKEDCGDYSIDDVQTNDMSCENDVKKLEGICIEECLKSIPCDLPEEEKYCICKQKCQQLFSRENNQIDQGNSKAEEKTECEPKPTKVDCASQRQNKLKNIECIGPMNEKSTTVPICKEIVMQTSTYKPRSYLSFTQLESFWQKIVNYFKARPNCPEPGDWKKKALHNKAEKAARAAGLVLIDPKCISPELLECLKPLKKDCKVCPDQSSNKSSTRSNSPEVKRGHSNFRQSSRNYSKSTTGNNLDEINKLLEEGEVKCQEICFRRSDPDWKRELYGLPGKSGTQASETFNISVAMHLNNLTNISLLSDQEMRLRKTYFGYPNVIPSRENILERAWRISIETYEKYHHPRKTFNLFDQIFKKVRKSIENYEDLEKLKTENMLRELDSLLEDPNSTKKKK